MVFSLYIKTKSFCLKYGPFLHALVNKIPHIKQWNFLNVYYTSSVRSVFLIRSVLLNSNVLLNRMVFNLNADVGPLVLSAGLTSSQVMWVLEAQGPDTLSHKALYCVTVSLWVLGQCYRWAY